MSRAEDIDAIAAEYVLGTLSGEARAAVAARLEREPVLRDAVQAWEKRLLPLAALAAPAEPSPALWSRIERSIGPAPVVKMPPKPSAFSRWWNSMPLWRGLAAAGFAMAAVLVSVVVTRVGLPTPQYMVVLVAPQDKSPGWVIQTSASRQLSLVPLGTSEVPPQKSLQFWTKGAQWTGPVSLGLVKQGQTLRIPIDKLPPLEPDQLFELTLEPENGSPIGRPTGPIQFIGRAVKVL